METFPLSFTLALFLVFGIANCRGYLLLSQEGSTCSNSTVLVCSFSNVTYVGIEKFNVALNRYSPLSSRGIAQNPHFEESFGDNVYNLKISQVQKYNGTQYQCSGYNKNFLLEYSNQWTVVLPAIEVCAGLEMNSTVKLDANAFSVVNQTEQYVAQPGHISGWIPVLIASVCSVLTVVVCLAGVALCVVAVRRRIQIKAIHEMPMSVQENGDGSNRDSPVLPARKVDPVSTHLVTRFSEAQPHLGVAPDDTNNEVLPSPQVASTDDAVGAVQVAGTVMMYDNVRLERNRTLLQSTVHQHSAVRCGDTLALLIPSRSGYHIASEDVSMSCNPAYGAIKFSQQGSPEEVADESSHQQTSPSILIMTKEVHMQGNPAYEALETMVPCAQAQGQVHQLQPSTGTESSEEVLMQVNPAYEAIKATLPSGI